MIYYRLYYNYGRSITITILINSFVKLLIFESSITTDSIFKYKLIFSKTIIDIFKSHNICFVGKYIFFKYHKQCQPPSTSNNKHSHSQD